MRDENEHEHELIVHVLQGLSLLTASLVFN